MIRLAIPYLGTPDRSLLYKGGPTFIRRSCWIPREFEPVEAGVRPNRQDKVGCGFADICICETLFGSGLSCETILSSVLVRETLTSPALVCGPFLALSQSIIAHHIGEVGLFISPKSTDVCHIPRAGVCACVCVCVCVCVRERERARARESVCSRLQ